MRYLLVASDKSSQLPIEIPNEIVTTKSSSGIKSTTFRPSKKVARQSPVKSKVKAKVKPKVKRKCRQIAKSIAK